MKYDILACALACSLLAAGCSSREVLVVYSPHGPDILKDYEALFEAAYPEVDVQTLDMGSQDVYIRVAAERKRRIAEARYSRFFERLPVALLRSTPDGRVLDANPAAGSLFGIDSIGELDERNISELWATPA